MRTQTSKLRNLTLLIFSAVAALAACGEDEPAPTVAGAPSDYLGSYTLVDDEFGTMVTVTVDGSTRTIRTNDLPNHETGEFPNDGNPNTISEQALTFTYPTQPVFTGVASPVRQPGVAVNGVPFEPGTAEVATCNTGESYHIEALHSIYNLGLDFNNAHVQPGGKYHYHGVSELLVSSLESGEDLVHVGFAADGFLIYYSRSGAYKSSYQLSQDVRAGIDCLATGPGNEVFDIEGTLPDGSYASDWVYVEGSGDLDECNGITIDGQYVYIITSDYPYVSRCLKGEFTEAGGPPPPGGP